MPQSASTPPASLAAGHKGAHLPWYPLALGLLLAATTDVIPQAITQVSALEFAGSVSGSADEGAFLALAYAAMKVFGLMVAAPMVARWGIKRSLMGTVWCSVGCSLALAPMPSLGVVFVLRAMQGLVGGAITSLSYGALVARVPKAHHASAQGLWGVVTLVLPAVCAALGGAFTDASHWQWAMLPVVPVGVLAAAVLQRTLPSAPTPHAAPAPAPLPSLVLWAIICVLGQLLVNMGTRYNWSDAPWMNPAKATLAVAAVIFVVLQWRLPSGQGLCRKEPLAYGEFTFACTTSLISGYGATATAMLAPMYVRRLFGFAAQDAGMLQLPSLLPVIMALGISVVCSHKQWLTAIQLIVLGMVLFMASLALWSQATWQVDLPFVATVVALRGAGLGLMAVPTARIAFARLEGLPAYYAAGYYQSARQWGGALATLSLTWRLAETQARFRYQIALNMAAADPSIAARVLQDVQAVAQRGLDASAAQALGGVLSAKALTQQVLVLAYNACFMEVLLVYGTLMTAALLFRVLGQASQRS